MGNMQCPAEDAAHLASVARDICLFPNYNPSPLLLNVLSVDYSLLLRNHYTAVQSSLTPKQLEDFTLDLRTTFGREGKVTLGGVGVVALSLAVLFDTLARRARGEWVPDSGPIPGLFVQNMRGYYPPHVYTVSEYLRLVPYIANNPTRMRKETGRYLKQLKTDDRSLDKLGENKTLLMMEDTTALNVNLGKFFAGCLKLHLHRIKNTTANRYFSSETREIRIVLNLNCDPETVDNDFLAKLQKSVIRTREAFDRCKPKSGYSPKSWLVYVAGLELIDAMFLPLHAAGGRSTDSLIAEREDFDLKANALRKWVE
ncbi:uncharacterized protein LOC121951845 [Plectropomus leopardus]|uniref:uncharacterized protein LOC121951845 n=1 Tax=Plectropomus leopardus TaxID=160734 RepID=UPI001C4B7BEF|nr:uncharacterized protein LOC121951845 [Plectropomus leopardus]